MLSHLTTLVPLVTWLQSTNELGNYLDHSSNLLAVPPIAFLLRSNETAS